MALKVLKKSPSGFLGGRLTAPQQASEVGEYRNPLSRRFPSILALVFGRVAPLETADTESDSHVFGGQLAGTFLRVLRACSVGDRSEA